MKTTNWLKFTTIALACLALNACEQGEYNDTVCDGTYVAECLDTSYYVYCKIKSGESSGMLERMKCPESQVCDQIQTIDPDGDVSLGPAQCLPIHNVPEKPESCVETATRCLGNIVQTCTHNVWQNAATPCEFGCNKGACLPEGTTPTPEQPDPNPKTCTFEGATQCNGQTVQTCTQGTWVDAAQPCANGCTQGICNETITSCSFSSKCDGNIVKNCYDLSDYGLGVEYVAENCRNYGMVCDEFQEDGETYAYCMQPCDKAGQTTNICSEDWFGSNYVTKGVCTDVGNNKLYYIEDYTADFTQCPGLCDYAKGECLYRAEDEGKACNSSNFQERCENGLPVICYNGIVTVAECENNTVCKVNAASHYAFCAQTCTTENETYSVCDNSDVETYDVEFLDTYQCLKTTDNDLAYFPILEEMCSSCQDLTCQVTEADRGTNLTEGDICNLNLYEAHCLDAQTKYSCEADYNRVEYVVTATQCDQSCQVAIHNNKHTVACAKGTCDTLGNTTLACDTTSDGGQFSVTQTCIPTESGTNHYFTTSYEECEGKCDPETKACVLLHPDQGETCQGMTDYPDNCQNNVLAYCYQNAVDAVDCSSEPGFSCQISKNLNGYGDCVKTCETPTELQKVCEYSQEYQRNIVYSRVCETIGNANYLFNAVEEACKGECNAEGTDCAK